MSRSRLFQSLMQGVNLVLPPHKARQPLRSPCLEALAHRHGPDQHLPLFVLLRRSPAPVLTHTANLKPVGAGRASTTRCETLPPG